MFVETEKRTEGEPAKVGAKSLSEAIRIGAGVLQESRHHYLAAGCGCALGMAAVGYGYVGESPLWNPLFKFVGEKSGLSREFLNKMEDKHVSGEMTAMQIASWLEAQGL